MKVSIIKMFCAGAKTGIHDNKVGPRIREDDGGDGFQTKLGRGSVVSHNKGFTLIELLVSIGIFAVITSVAVINHSSFDSSILLTNLSYEIGLSIRQAQVFGITVKGTSANAQEFDSGYGIHFDLATPTRYYLFEDKQPPDHFCNGTECTSPVETFVIHRGNKISKICLDLVCGFTVVDISFIRPYPDAYIMAGSTRYGKAEICVTSPVNNAVRKVIVESTGQISVNADVTVGAPCI